MSKKDTSNSIDDQECVQRDRLKKIESDIIRIERQMKSLERTVAEMKKRY